MSDTEGPASIDVPFANGFGLDPHPVKTSLVDGGSCRMDTRGVSLTPRTLTVLRMRQIIISDDFHKPPGKDQVNLFWFNVYLFWNQLFLFL